MHTWLLTALYIFMDAVLVVTAILLHGTASSDKYKVGQLAKKITRANCIYYPYGTDSPEWVYFGSVPYDLGPTAIPIADDGSTFLVVPDRSTLRRAQTPQGFDLQVIRSAYDIGLQDPNFQATDDCGIVLRYRPDIPVRIVMGEEQNMKVTYQGDLPVLETYL